MVSSSEVTRGLDDILDICNHVAEIMMGFGSHNHETEVGEVRSGVR